MKVMKRSPVLATVLVLVVSGACGAKDETKPGELAAVAPTEFGGERPVTLRLPDAFDPSVSHPLLVMVHGFQSSGLVEETYLKLSATASERGYLYLTPDGTFNEDGARYWNDWPGGHGGSTVDDVGYLAKLIADVRAAYNVDPKRIGIIGHSNGGAMTHRLACELSGELAAVAVFAGYMPVDVASICKPTSPLHVLQLHGDMDPAVPYEASESSLGARGCVAYWAKHDGCTGTEERPPLDLVANLAGAETTVLEHNGCTAASADLWTMVGAGHVPGFSPNFAKNLFDYFDAHTK